MPESLHKIEYPHTERFINREREIEQVEQILNQIKRLKRPTVEGVIYFGIPGIGKSRILKYIESRCRQEKFFPASVDFQHANFHSYFDYLLHLSDQFERRRTKPRFRDILLRGVNISTDPKVHAEQALPIFVREVKQRLRSQPLVLLLDSCEFCTSELFDWIGQQFLIHLLNSRVGPIALFLASRGPQVLESNWPPEIVRATQLQHVPALDFEATKQHIAAIDIAQRCLGGEETVFGLSVGHPFSTEALIYFLQKLNVEVGDFPQHRQQLARQLYDEVIHRYVLAGVKTWEPEIFDLACIPRRFDPLLLEKMAPHHPHQWYAAGMRDLQEPDVHLIYIDSGKPAYQLEKTLRKLLHTAVSILHPQRTLELNQQLKKFYEGQLRDDASVGRPAAASLMELLYHHFQIEILSNRPPQFSTEKLLQQKLGAHFRPAQIDDQIQLHQLHDLIRKDADFNEILGGPAINRLVQIIEQFAQTPPQMERQLSHLSIRHSPPSEYHVSWYLGNQTLAPAQTIHSRVKFSIQEWRAHPVERGKVAFKAYLTNPAQNFIREGEKHAIFLTTNVMDIPFELMHDGNEFLCLSRPIGRRVESMAVPKKLHFQPQAAWRALVIGNPSGDLSHAEKEAMAVADLLVKNRVQVDRLIGKHNATLNKVVEFLSLHSYHLIHYAGHGFFNKNHPALSGLLFDIKDYGNMISADELQRYLQGPAFIFFSACWAAAAEKETTQVQAQGHFIQNLAVAALEGGACGCLGPMWKIGERVAKAFAIHFYTYLLQGHGTGEAVRRARKKIRHRQPDTWASWVLFGDPFMHPFTATSGNIQN